MNLAAAAISLEMRSGALTDEPAKAFSQRSRFALDGANFFQAEAVGVVLPVLSVFLRESGWSYSQIGFASAIAGLGTLLFQTPAGIMIDRLRCRRLLYALASVAVGVTMSIIPLARHSHVAVDALLFLSGAAQSIFIPVLGALALALVGYRALNRTLGENQGWNHAGNIAAALIAFFAIKKFGSASIFYAVAAASLVGAFTVLLIRQRDLDEKHADNDDGKSPRWTALLRDPRVLALLLAVALFHLANAPVLPVTALYIKRLGGSDQLTTFTVLSAQLVMIPVAWLTGRLCDRWGTKAVMGIAFWVLPTRIVAYTFAHHPHAVVVLQALDGIGAGIYSVAIVSFSAALSRGKGGFNSLMGLFATAQAVGGVVGPVVTGEILEHLGFSITFITFAALALAGAVVYQFLVSAPEGGRGNQPQAAHG